MSSVEQMPVTSPEVAFDQRHRDLMAMAASIVMRLHEYQRFKPEGYGNHDYVFHFIDKARDEKGYHVDPPEASQYLAAQGMRPPQEHPDIKRMRAEQLYSENYQGAQ